MLLRKLFFLFSIFFAFSVQGQTPKEIDSTFEAAYIDYRNSKLEAAINQSFAINKRSKAIKYEKGEVRSLMLIADCLMILGTYKKSLEYVNKVETFKEYLEKTPFDHWIIKKTAIECYLNIELPAMAQIEYEKALLIIKQEKNKEKRYLGLFGMYMLSGSLPFNHIDSFRQQLFYALDLMKDKDFKAHQKEHYSINLAGLYIKLGIFYTTKKLETDSALYYFELAQKQLHNQNQHFYNAQLKEGLSNVFEKLGDNKKSITYCLEALSIFQHLNVAKDIQRNYGKLSVLYGKIGAIEKEKEFLALSSSIQDSLDIVKSQGRDETILQLVHEREKEIATSAYRHKIVTIAIIFFSIVILSLTIYYFNRYTKRKKREILLENEQRIAEKEQLLMEKELVLQDSIAIIEQNSKETEQLHHLIEQKEEETQLLKEKINESFADVIQLAKENDPHFWIRFQETYPQFAPNLLSVNPLLKPSELSLCAYIYLGFTTKEIADYTFRAIKTIESNRYNLRKRLYLKPETDLAVFLNKKHT